MSRFFIKTLEEKEWGFKGGNLQMLGMEFCDFCGFLRGCASFDSADGEYGTVDICKECVIKAFKKLEEQMHG